MRCCKLLGIDGQEPFGGLGVLQGHVVNHWYPLLLKAGCAPCPVQDMNILGRLFGPLGSRVPSHMCCGMQAATNPTHFLTEVSGA